MHFEWRVAGERATAKKQSNWPVLCGTLLDSCRCRLWSHGADLAWIKGIEYLRLQKCHLHTHCSCGEIHANACKAIQTTSRFECERRKQTLTKKTVFLSSNLWFWVCYVFPANCFLFFPMKHDAPFQSRNLCFRFVLILWLSVLSENWCAEENIEKKKYLIN